MEYAIRTLEIELAPIETALRIQKQYSVYPEYASYDDSLHEDKNQIETALKILRGES